MFRVWYNGAKLTETRPPGSGWTPNLLCNASGTMPAGYLLGDIITSAVGNGNGAMFAVFSVYR